MAGTWWGRHAAATIAESFYSWSTAAGRKPLADMGLLKPQSPPPGTHFLKVTASNLSQPSNRTLSMQIYEPFRAILIQYTYIHYTCTPGIRKMTYNSDPLDSTSEFTGVPSCQVYWSARYQIGQAFNQMHYILPSLLEDSSTSTLALIPGQDLSPFNRKLDKTQRLSDTGQKEELNNAASEMEAGWTFRYLMPRGKFQAATQRRWI